MIPDFNDVGYLPPGIHTATLAEIAARFGGEPEMRRALMESLGWLVEAAWRAGVKRIVVNGSFTTDKWEPNDVDRVLLAGSDYPLDGEAAAELENGFPYMNFEVVNETQFKFFTDSLFASDRSLTAKGMVEVEVVR